MLSVTPNSRSAHAKPDPLRSHPLASLHRQAPAAVGFRQPAETLRAGVFRLRQLHRNALAG